jgi:hypothetical protein
MADFRTFFFFWGGGGLFKLIKCRTLISLYRKLNYFVKLNFFIDGVKPQHPDEVYILLLFTSFYTPGHQS